jgi:hypothetical protein
MGQACRVSASDSSAARVERLHHELRDDGIWIPADENLSGLLLTELDYARHPHSHEGVAPRYGALLTARETALDAVGSFSVLELDHVSLEVARRLADGRSSFVLRTVDGVARLVCFDRTREYESSAVHLALAADSSVIQRLGRGWVRLTTREGVATWDGIRWASKLLSARIAELVAPTLRGADPVLLANLLEFCVHWLGAGRTGATIVWRLDGDAHQLDHVGFGSSVAIPPLDLRRRSHFAALLNALAQYDRAALVDENGRVRTVGVHLRTSERSRRDIAPFRGTRHTSALRFSADAPTAAVFVVSSSGTLSIFWQGRALDVV